MKLSSNVVGDFNDESNFSHELLLTNIQASNIHKAFANGSSANMKLSITQWHKMLGRILESLLKTGLP